jgi:hypothetical protein
VTVFQRKLLIELMLAVDLYEKLGRVPTEEEIQAEMKRLLKELQDE